MSILHTYIRLFHRDSWFFCGSIGEYIKFCIHIYICLFCRYIGLFHRGSWLFCGSIGLLCRYYPILNFELHVPQSENISLNVSFLTNIHGSFADIQGTFVDIQDSFADLTGSFADVVCSVLQCVAACCSALQCVAVRSSVLQCVAMCCSVLQCVAVCCRCALLFSRYDVYQF